MELQHRQEKLLKMAFYENAIWPAILTVSQIARVKDARISKEWKLTTASEQEHKLRQMTK